MEYGRSESSFLTAGNAIISVAIFYEKIRLIGAHFVIILFFNVYKKPCVQKSSVVTINRLWAILTCLSNIGTITFGGYTLYDFGVWSQ